MANIFHAGEKEIQEKVGESQIADRNSKAIHESIHEWAINFIEKQPMAIVSSQNEHQEVWTSLLIGDFGFVKVPHPNAVSFEMTMAMNNPEDVFYSNILAHAKIGSLFIELGTRKRYRINGDCSIKGTKIEIDIKEAYPNCPKYIQRRIISQRGYFEQTVPGIFCGKSLRDSERNWIVNADTFFMGTSFEGNLDASHRGGNPGFVEIIDNGTLKIPDYPGNSLFNSFGNIVQNPNAGLLFIDFERRQTLQLTGKARLLFNQHSETDLKITKGTGRYCLFETTGWIKTENHHNVNWEFLEYSPFNP